MKRFRKYINDKAQVSVVKQEQHNTITSQPPQAITSKSDPSWPGDDTDCPLHVQDSIKSQESQSQGSQPTVRPKQPESTVRPKQPESTVRPKQPESTVRPKQCGL
ncbi:hypothetical protein NHX12_006589 [Muraenolepis orangiensis]|uniref:Uncharacterized protein n=1 Tax=Muraenolepis orangiensis TaxID=630683 RepID=A0A9Q0DSV0_9TELE|nr:hypothetical protein NHX12_021929 [Muraenolepis orangiensis]KAJ3593045.1 hypothetical protein NHX12_005383 [Muraenolepis orangiensis]KAJ3594255.1 hypothetical protein NHX12_006586 [Muraenolepis orangiensis]KAJ3594256.1 hypothetical protein NHX12_006587 [Muraenolepis orangiensis]KAJ3594258.1 hypothetical protein NHX12_006589 [Muraenolepis orangiensis]